MTPPLTDLQLDALRELANIASGTAATALSQMLAREVEHQRSARAARCRWPTPSTPAARPRTPVAGVVIAARGQAAGDRAAADRRTGRRRAVPLLGVAPGTEVGDSALREIGNILATAYLNALAAMTGLELLPSPAAPEPPTCSGRSSPRCRAHLGRRGHRAVLDSELDVAGAAVLDLVPAAARPPAGSASCWRRSGSLEAGDER